MDKEREQHMFMLTAARRLYTQNREDILNSIMEECLEINDGTKLISLIIKKRIPPMMFLSGNCF